MDFKLILEFFYMAMGFIIFSTGVLILQNKNNKKRIGSAIFWFVLGVIFAFGNFIPAYAVGALIVVLGVLSAFKQVNAGDIAIIPQKIKDEGARALKNLVFLPPASIALSAFLYATFLPKILPESAKGIAGNLTIALAGVTGIIVTILVTRAKPKYMVEDSTRLIRLMGPSSILPQLLAALGAVFTVAGVGNVISEMFVPIIPQGNRLAGIVAYCLLMMLFTAIMGNGFAAFTVITIAIGIPFVIDLGANPAIVGAMGLTAGYCGTLITPMAANFNIVPANLLETKSQYTVIKYQLPFALSLLALHIILMYTLGFSF